MPLQLLLVALAYCSGITCARPIQTVLQRELLNRSTIQSEGLSVEVIVGVIAVAVAIFGIALPFVWPSLRSRLDSRSTSMLCFTIATDVHRRLAKSSKLEHPALR